MIIFVYFFACGNFLFSVESQNAWSNTKEAQNRKEKYEYFSGMRR